MRKPLQIKIKKRITTPRRQIIRDKLSIPRNYIAEKNTFQFCKFRFSDPRLDAQPEEGAEGRGRSSARLPRAGRERGHRHRRPPHVRLRAHHGGVARAAAGKVKVAAYGKPCRCATRKTIFINKAVICWR